MNCGCQCGGACDGGAHSGQGAGPQRDWSLSDFFSVGDVIGLAGLGAIPTDQAILDQVGASAMLKAGSGSLRKSTYDAIANSLAAGQLVGFNTAQCSSAPGGNVKLAQTASGLALTGASIGLTASGAITAAALAPWTMGISALIGIFPLIFGHHAQAVKKEQQTLCATVPAVNNTLQVIDQAVKSGQVEPQHGIDALNSLYSDFNTQVASILKSDSEHCNAACVWRWSLSAIILKKTAEYQDLEAAIAGNQAVVPARPNTIPNTVGPAASSSSYASFYSGAQPAPAASSGLPSWLPIAAAVAAGLFLMREL